MVVATADRVAAVVAVAVAGNHRFSASLRARRNFQFSIAAPAVS